MSRLSPARLAQLIRSVEADVAELEYAVSRSTERLAKDKRALHEKRAALEKLRQQPKGSD